MQMMVSNNEKLDNWVMLTVTLMDAVLSTKPTKSSDFMDSEASLVDQLLSMLAKKSMMLEVPEAELHVPLLS